MTAQKMRKLLSFSVAPCLAAAYLLAVVATKVLRCEGCLSQTLSEGCLKCDVAHRGDTDGYTKRVGKRGEEGCVRRGRVSEEGSAGRGHAQGDCVIQSRMLHVMRRPRGSSKLARGEIHNRTCLFGSFGAIARKDVRIGIALLLSLVICVVWYSLKRLSPPGSSELATSSETTTHTEPSDNQQVPPQPNNPNIQPLDTTMTNTTTTTTTMTDISPQRCPSCKHSYEADVVTSSVSCSVTNTDKDKSPPITSSCMINMPPDPPLCDGSSSTSHQSVSSCLDEECLRPDSNNIIITETSQEDKKEDIREDSGRLQQTSETNKSHKDKGVDTVDRHHLVVSGRDTSGLSLDIADPLTERQDATSSDTSQEGTGQRQEQQQQQQEQQHQLVHCDRMSSGSRESTCKRMHREKHSSAARFSQLPTVPELSCISYDITSPDALPQRDMDADITSPDRPTHTRGSPDRPTHTRGSPDRPTHTRGSPDRPTHTRGFGPEPDGLDNTTSSSPPKEPRMVVDDITGGHEHNKQPLVCLSSSNSNLSSPPTVSRGTSMCRNRASDDREHIISTEDTLSSLPPSSNTLRIYMNAKDYHPLPAVSPERKTERKRWGNPQPLTPPSPNGSCENMIKRMDCRLSHRSSADVKPNNTRSSPRKPPATTPRVRVDTPILSRKKLGKPILPSRIQYGRSTYRRTVSCEDTKVLDARKFIEQVENIRDDIVTKCPLMSSHMRPSTTSCSTGSVMQHFFTDSPQSLKVLQQRTVQELVNDIASVTRRFTDTDTKQRWHKFLKSAKALEVGENNKLLGNLNTYTQKASKLIGKPV
eukprot:GHVQ01036132.1.p1 GENE.GHVQ01036132.1~~GHVQ01036132.1.p1  ORF type:complete len:814 (+),score=164.13 GHVQ01036132.1:258-2699(+)